MTLKVGLLTAGPPPFIMGTSAISITGATANALMWVTSTNPAPRDGTITSVTVGLGTSGTFRIYTGSLNVTTFTVRATTADLSGTGTNSYPVSLPVLAGDYIGFWSSSSTGAPVKENSPQTGHTCWFRSQFTPPVTNSSYSMSSTVDEIALQGTGS